MRIDELDKLIEYGFLDQTFFVHGRGQVFEVYGCFDGFAESADEVYVYVGFEEGGANFFDHVVECLRILLGGFS